MDSAELFRAFTDSMDRMRGELRGDIGGVKVDIKDGLKDVSAQVRGLSEKVATQNGRVTKLELLIKPDDKSATGLLRKAFDEWWFPWVVLATIGTVGGKQVGVLLSAAMDIFKPKP